MSQTEMVLAHLKSGKTLTSLEAIKLYRITRLASRIYDLRRTDEGKKIRGYLCEVKTKFGKTHVKRYYMGGRKNGR